MRKEIIEKAKQEYLELKKFIENYKGTFDELYNELEDTFNFDAEERFFDVNYGRYINTTVYDMGSCFNNTEHFVLSDVVTIWNSDNGNVFPEAENFVVCHHCNKLTLELGGKWEYIDDELLCNKCARKIK